MPTFRYPEAIVSTAWLNEHLDSPEIRIFDCTTYLEAPTAGLDAAYTVVSGREDFAKGHIPGSGFLDLQEELSDHSSPMHLRFTMPAPEELAAAFGRRGVGDDSHVVLYSRANMQWATRVWWMLRAIGFDRASILDGGFEKWAAEDRPLSQADCAYPPETLTPNPRAGLFTGLDEVKAAVAAGDTCTINALSPELHRGESPRYGRPGRIPSSVNVPVAALLNPGDRTFAAPAVAAQHFSDVGATPDKRMIVYCGGGIAATLDAFVLHQLGYDNIAVYDASMSEWARDESLPMEVG